MREVSSQAVNALVFARFGNPQSQHGTDPPVNTQATTFATLDYRESGLVLWHIADISQKR